MNEIATRPSADKLMYAAGMHSATASWYTNTETTPLFTGKMVFALHDHIATGIGPEAAAQYTNMVAGLYLIEQNVTPARFIDAVHTMEEAEWIYPGPRKGEQYHDLAKAIGMGAAIMTEMRIADEEEEHEIAFARTLKVCNLLATHKDELVEPYRGLYNEHIEQEQTRHRLLEEKYAS